MPGEPSSPRGASQLFDFDDLETLSNEVTAPAARSLREAPPSKQDTAALAPELESGRFVQETVPPEELAAAEANALRVLGDALAGVLDGRRALPLPLGSAVYVGEMSHPCFGEAVPLRLEAEYADGLWQGEWVAMDQREPIEIELQRPEGPSYGRVHIRNVGGLDTTELQGTAAADGTLTGQLSQGGLGGGTFELRPVPRARVPLDWAKVCKGRDLFVAGWGGFDVPEAHKAFREAAPGVAIPSVEALRSYGYLDRFFPTVSEPLQRERLRRALLASSSALAQFVVRHCAFWSEPANANRLDEVAQHFDSVPAKAAMKENPRALLNRLSRERAVTGHKFVRFAHLAGVLRPSTFSSNGELCSGAGTFELSVMEDSHTVAKAAQELNNCAAGYVGDVRRKRCALLALRREGKLVAMGEWDLHERKWSQISEHSDEPIRSEWQCMYEQLEGERLFPVEARLMLPGSREDSVSIFNPVAARALDPLCRQSGLSRSLLSDWTRLLPGWESHTEAASALLLWLVESRGGRDVAQLLLERGADADSMTDDGWTALMLATDAGQDEIVRLILEWDADVDAKGAGSGRTALMMASSGGRLELVRALVDRRADLNIVARLSGKTALVEAVEQGHSAAVSFLVEHGAGLDAQRHDGRTALILAAETGQAPLVQLMTERRANPDLRSEDGTSALLAAHRGLRPQTLHALVSARADLELELGRERRTILMWAAVAGQTEVMELLISKRAQHDATHANGETALAMAASCRQWPSVRCLAALSADLSAKCSDGHTALTLAAGAGELGTVEALAQRRADLDIAGPNGRTALADAAVAGQVEVLRALVRHEADLNSAGEGGDAALVAAAEAKKWTSVQLLVELGARLEVRDASSRTALIIASSCGHSKTVSALLERRARLESRAADGSTALVAAAQERQWMVVRRLADARADLESKAGAKCVPMLVAEAAQWETLVYLAKRGAGLNVRGDGGKTVLMLAVEGGQADVVHCLLQRKAWPDIRDDAGETALLRACNRQQEHTARVLWQGGAEVEDAVRRTHMPGMAKLLLQWNGVEVDDT